MSAEIAAVAEQVAAAPEEVAAFNIYLHQIYIESDAGFMYIDPLYHGNSIETEINRVIIGTH